MLQNIWEQIFTASLYDWIKSVGSYIMPITNVFGREGRLHQRTLFFLSNDSFVVWLKAVPFSLQR